MNKYKVYDYVTGTIKTRVFFFSFSFCIALFKDVVVRRVPLFKDVVVRRVPLFKDVVVRRVPPPSSTMHYEII